MGGGGGCSLIDRLRFVLLHIFDGDGAWQISIYSNITDVFMLKEAYNPT